MVYASYELYSWQEGNGTWNFRLTPSPSGVNVSAEQVFDKKYVLSDVGVLKRELSRLPVGTTIYWLDHLTGIPHETKDKAKLGYPTSKMVQEIRHYAEAHKIKVEMLSREDGH